MTQEEPIEHCSHSSSRGGGDEVRKKLNLVWACKMESTWENLCSELLKISSWKDLNAKTGYYFCTNEKEIVLGDNIISVDIFMIGSPGMILLSHW